jgi:DNA gyrase subunit A
VAEIREMGRATQGVTLIALDDGTTLTGLQRVVERDSDVVNGNGNGHDSGAAAAPEAGAADAGGPAEE